MKDAKRKMMALMKGHQLDIPGFAEKSGIPEERMKRLIYGGQRLKKDELEMIAGAFDLTMDELSGIEPVSRKEAQEMGMSKFYREITERLNMIMKLKKVDTDGFAERCGFTIQRTERLINEKAVITIPEAVKVADEFNVSLDYIMGFYPYPFPTAKNSQEALVFEQIGKMTPEELWEFSERLGKEIKKEQP